MSKRMGLMLVLLALVITALGCASHDKKLSEVMESWVGHDISDCIAKWGPPQQVLDIKGGNKIYTWSSSRSYTAPGYMAADGFGGVNVYQGQTRTSTSTRSFWVDSDGRIYRWAWKGR